MATVARSTGIAKHLIDFCVAHIQLHGKTQSAHTYIKANLALWREQYGESVTVEVTKVVNRFWADKKS